MPPESHEAAGISTPRRGRTWLAVAVATAAAVALAACSSNTGTGASAATGSSLTGGTDAATSACLAAADAYLASYQTLTSALPASYTALPSKPAASGSVVHLVGPLPTELALSNAQGAAVKQLGWKFDVVNFNGSVEDLNAKFEQAVSMKPTMITLSGFPVAAISKSLDDAKKAGVVVVLADISDSPSGYPGFAGVVEGATTYTKVGELNAYQFMKASNCHGSAAIFSLAYPILTVGTDAFTNTVKAHCPACSVSISNLQGKDLGTTAATSAIVTRLQSNPSTKYVYAVIGGVASGLTSALRQAGLNGITVFGADPDENAIAAIKDGTNGWWVQYGGQLNGWAEIDAGLRAIQTQKPVADNPDYPLGLLTKATTPADVALPVVPASYASDYAALWHVSS